MLRMRSVPNRNTKNKLLRFTFSKQRRIWSFHVVVLQRTAKKCTKNYKARAQLLFCSLNLLFGDVLVAVAVVFCVRSLMSADKYPSIFWRQMETTVYITRINARALIGQSAMFYCAGKLMEKSRVF